MPLISGPQASAPRAWVLLVSALLVSGLRAWVPLISGQRAWVPLASGAQASAVRHPPDR